MIDEFEMIDVALRATLSDILGIDADRVATFDHSTKLFGELPELDSMAVATVLTELEDRLAISIDDDELDIEVFETFGNLSKFLRMKALG